MADKNNKEFQWNFNLDDTDSDFTDIDFSNASFEPSEKDIQPIIFVRDETQKKSGGTQSTVRPASASASAGSGKPVSSSQKKPAAQTKKPAAKKKKKGIDLNWRLIALIAAAVLLVALLVLLLSKCGKKEEKAWTKVEAGTKVRTVMDDYFAAKRKGDADSMRKVLVSDAVVNASVLGLEAGIYKDYTDIELEQYPGISKNEAVVCATYDTVLNLIDASVPSLSWFYAKPDEKGNLRLMTVSEFEKDETINNYVKAAAKLLENTTVADIKTRYSNALSSNPILTAYLNNISEGKYYDIPTPTESTEPTQQVETTVPATSEEVRPVEAGMLIYINAGTLNMRSAPTTDEDNVIWRFTRGWCVSVIGETDDWYKIRDEVQNNPGSGAPQTCTYYEGYISKAYAVHSYSQIQWP